MRAATAITNELIATGLSPVQTALLMELVLSLSTGSSGANPVESPEYRTLEKRRAWDRDRKAREREAEREAKRLSALSTGHPPESTGNRVEKADVCTVVLEDKEKGLSVKERKKGSRLLSNARVSDDDRAFAIENGIPENRVDAEWTEFVDYWIGVPGSRGVKLDWPATWRNRIRQISNKYRGSNGQGFSANRTNPTSGSPPTRDTAIIAGMGRALERRRAARAADDGGQVQRSDGVAAEPDADCGAAPDDDQPPRQLTLLAAGHSRG